MAEMKKYQTIDEYIAAFPPDTALLLEELRKTMASTAPLAIEKITYGIPTFYLNGNLVHFAAYTTHLGLYPGSMPIRELANDLKAYETSKGTIKFPLDKPLPVELIRKIVLLCVERNSRKK